MDLRKSDILGADGVLPDRQARRIVTLRTLVPSNIAEGYLDWMNDPEIGKYLESRFRSWSADDLHAYITKMNDSTLDWLFGIFVEGNRYIGNIKLGPVEIHHSRASIGIMIGDKAAHGKGYGLDALRQIMDLGFSRLGLKKLTAGCYRPNEASRRLFEKAGFTVEGELRSHALCESGERCDVLLMGCLEETYMKMQEGKAP